MLFLQSGVKKAHDYEMEGGTPSHPAFAPDGSGFHPLSGPSYKNLFPTRTALPSFEHPASGSGSGSPAADSLADGKGGRSSGTSTTSGSIVDPKDSNSQIKAFSPMLNHLNLQGNHPSRR